MIRLLLLAFIGFTLAAQDVVTVPTSQSWTGILESLRESSSADEAKKEFQFVLIVREWQFGYSYSQSGYSTMAEQWTYKTHLFEDIEELREALEWNSGKRWDKDNIIGLWRLSDQATMDLSSKDVVHVEPEHVRERRWKERVWTITSTLDIDSGPKAANKEKTGLFLGKPLGIGGMNAKLPEVAVEQP
jgi:hypothetical protein